MIVNSIMFCMCVCLRLYLYTCMYEYMFVMDVKDAMIVLWINLY